MRKKILIMGMAMLLSSVLTIGCANTETDETLNNSISEESSEQSSAEKEDKKNTADVKKETGNEENIREASKEETDVLLKILPQIGERYVLKESKDVELTKDLQDDYGIIKEISVIETDMDTEKEGDYDVTYQVTVFTETMEKAQDAVKNDQKIEKNVSDGNKKTEEIKITEKVSVVGKEQADQLIEEGKTVITDNGEEYASDTETDTATEKDPEEKDSKTEQPSDETSESEEGSVSETPSASDSDTDTSPSDPAATTTTQNRTEDQTSFHVHNWVAQTKTVHRDAVTTQQWVQDSAAYDEPVYEEQPVYESVGKVRCKCGAEYDRVEQWEAHVMDREDNYDDWGHGAYEVFWVDVQTGTQTVQTGTVHHDATGHYETVTVSGAYDETVTTGYVCSGCGATK